MATSRKDIAKQLIQKGILEPANLNRFMALSRPQLMFMAAAAQDARLVDDPAQLFIEALQGGNAAGRTNFAYVHNALGRPDLGDLGGEIGNTLNLSDETIQDLADITKDYFEDHKETLEAQAEQEQTPDTSYTSPFSTPKLRPQGFTEEEDS